MSDATYNLNGGFDRAWLHNGEREQRQSAAAERLRRRGGDQAPGCRQNSRSRFPKDTGKRRRGNRMFSALQKQAHQFGLAS
jgi:hypothetical protein